MKALLIALVSTLMAATAAHAQTDGVERLGIMVQVASILSPGGEEMRLGGGANPADPATVTHGFSLRPDRCSWAGARFVESDAYFAWAVEITPLRVVNNAVTFRLDWARTREEGKPSTQSKNTVELTLRPGEAMPLDLKVQRVCPGAPQNIGASLRVAVVQYPDPDYDRRLLALDLWLVEKLSDGSERSQPLSLRGLYHRPIPFYFESITEKAMALDIFGEVTVASGDGSSDVKIMTRSRIFDPSQPPGRPFPRETTATIKITPNEVVSVQLPQVTDASAFASRALSVRIRLRQVR